MYECTCTNLDVHAPTAQPFLEPEEGHISLMYNESVKILDKAIAILEL
jgi:hypothetical protein